MLLLMLHSDHDGHFFTTAKATYLTNDVLLLKNVHLSEQAKVYVNSWSCTPFFNFGVR